MEPAEVVVQALVTGAGAGLGGTASAAVADGYSALKHALVRRLTGRHRALSLLETIDNGGERTDTMVHELSLTGAVDDGILAAAQHLLTLADPEGTRSGQYRVDLRQARGVQVGNGNTQNNNFVPAQKGAHARHHAQGSSSVTVTDSRNVTVDNSRKSTKISIPLIGPLFSFASVHPVIAVATTVVVLGGTGVAAKSALSDSNSGVPTDLIRGFRIPDADSSTTPTGYDFSQTPPVVAGPNADAIYAQRGEIFSTSGKLAHWFDAGVPTAADCRAAIAKQPEREVTPGVGTLTCYLDQKGNVGYFTVTAIPSNNDYFVIDTAHLG